jgi:small conductance mechanosensitive channel
MVMMVSVALALMPLWSAQGQLWQSNAPTTVNRPPAQVQRLGFIEVAPVYFKSRKLLEVAAPTVRDRSNPGELIPVEERALQISVNLNRVIETNWQALEAFEQTQQQPDYITRFDPRSLRVVVSTLNGETILEAVDGERSQPQQLLTVTQYDADYHGTTIEQLARRWQSTLYQTLHSALSKRLPGALVRQVTRAIPIGLGMVAMSLSLWFVQRWLKQRHIQLKEQQTTTTASTALNEQDASEEAIASRRLLFLTLLQDQFTLEQRQTFNRFLRWLIRWLHIGVWVGGGFFILTLFPWTNEWAWNTLVNLPFKLLGIWFALGLANRFSDALIDRAMKAWADRQLFIFTPEDVKRTSLRAKTSATALKGLTSFIAYGIAVLLSLQVLGVPTDSVLTGSAIIGLTISFGSQNLVRDLVTGCLIIWEDQFAIGDVIVVDSMGGLVESMNLRITQIRNDTGSLITIPNGTITKVENLTRSWSRVNFTIEVAYDTDIQHALTVMRTVAQTFYDDPDWRSQLVEPPEVLGVDRVTHAGMLIRVWIKTQPLHQWTVERAFRIRVRMALDDHQIAIGTPQQTFWSGNEANSSAHSSTTSPPSSAEAIAALPHASDQPSNHLPKEED